MSLSAGTKLGPYEIVAPIGAGGMGEVYRAHDPRMGRDVAVKISAERFSARFSREVHAVAALNHANICHIYDVGPDYLVMELVEGPTLAERIKQGALPLDEALKTAKQIADALEAAHEKGIVHRDLKPGNIKLRLDGAVKVLDFGLAKMTGATESGERAEHSPTLTLDAATSVGVVLGTAAYMSPEQARGKPVDKRADIWAFGVVLYEMLSGKRVFSGDGAADVISGGDHARAGSHASAGEDAAAIASLSGKGSQEALAGHRGCLGSAGGPGCRRNHGRGFLLSPRCHRGMDRGGRARAGRDRRGLDRMAGNTSGGPPVDAVQHGSGTSGDDRRKHYCRHLARRPQAGLSGAGRRRAAAAFHAPAQ
jgi:predicted Ser/Thr protein kinase